MLQQKPKPYQVDGEEYLAPSLAVDILIENGTTSATAYMVLVRAARAGRIRTVPTGQRSRGYHAADVRTLATSRARR